MMCYREIQPLCTPPIVSAGPKPALRDLGHCAGISQETMRNAGRPPWQYNNFEQMFFIE